MQAHDLLEKYAERAQKLAQESDVGPETYQRLALSDGIYVLHLLIGMGGGRERPDFFLKG